VLLCGTSEADTPPALGVPRQQRHRAARE